VAIKLFTTFKFNCNSGASKANASFEKLSDFNAAGALKGDADLISSEAFGIVLEMSATDLI